MINVCKKALRNLSWFVVGGLFLLAASGYSGTLEIMNETDKQVVIKSFRKDYTDLIITEDMEIDPQESHKFTISIEQSKFDQNNKALRKPNLDFIRFTVDDDDMTISWDDLFSIFLTRNGGEEKSSERTHAESYDIKTVWISRNVCTLKLTNKK